MPDLLEEQLGRLIDHIKAGGVTNPQEIVFDLEANLVSEEFRDCLSFFQSMSGPSRNLFYDVACGRRTKKKSARHGHSREKYRGDI